MTSSYIADINDGAAFPTSRRPWSSLMDQPRCRNSPCPALARRARREFALNGEKCQPLPVVANNAYSIGLVQVCVLSSLVQDFFLSQRIMIARPVVVDDVTVVRILKHRMVRI